MKDEPNIGVEPYRSDHPIVGSGDTGVNWGFFRKGPLRILSSGTPPQGDIGWPWEHVSVSLENRCPTWEEMREVKEMFWKDTETVFQFHPAKQYYVNAHPYVLHLWRRIDEETELPPSNLLA